MKGWNFISEIVKKIETLGDGLIAYAYVDGNATGTCKWWTVCINDFEMYFHDKRFKALSNAWHKAAIARGFKVTFAYCQPKEKKLIQLAEEDNLIMNVD